MTKTNVIPENFPAGYQVGMLIGLASNRKLVPRELIVAMSMQPPPTHLSSGMMMVSDQPVEMARELLADAAVAANAKYLWFVDDDTIPPPNTLRRLHYVLENNPSAMAVGGVYVTKCTPCGPVVFRGLGLGPFWQWKVGDIFEVSGMGAGCMMIKCEVFKKIPKPWFPWIEDKQIKTGFPSITVSEDIAFCNAVRASGYKVLAHGGVICDHWDTESGQVFSLPPNSYPLQDRDEAPPAEFPPDTLEKSENIIDGNISTSKS